MKRQTLAIAAAACIALVTLTANIQAGHPGSRPVSTSKKIVVNSSHVNHRNNVNVQGVHRSTVAINHNKSSLSRYHVRQYRGWNKYCYYPSQRCYGFYDPQCDGWFYWYEPSACFLPIGYINAYPPQTNGSVYLPQNAGQDVTSTRPVQPLQQPIQVPSPRPVESSTPLESPISLGGDAEQ